MKKTIHFGNKNKQVMCIIFCVIIARDKEAFKNESHCV
jgi:hypothetical protein